MATALYLIAALVLLLLNAFFVLAEFSAVSLRASRLEELIQQGRRGAKIAQHVHNHLDEYLSMCQVGITFASIALGFVGERAAHGHAGSAHAPQRRQQRKRMRGLSHAGD